MKQYLDLVKTVLERGKFKKDRTNTGTLSVFGHQARYDLSEGFPLLTTKKLHIKSIIHELLWFLSGDSNIRYLNENGVKIWNEWANEKGDLGPIYGVQWRKWKNNYGEEIDQISKIIHQLKENPNSRRHVILSYNPGEIEKMALPPCHMFFQFYVQDETLSCQMYQRSADVFLGVPFNIASYSLLTHMIAQVLNLKVGEFIHTLGDAHLYINHIEQAKLQIKRTPKPLPSLKINPNINSIFDFCYNDFEIMNYHPDPHIKAKISV